MTVNQFSIVMSLAFVCAACDSAQTPFLPSPFVIPTSRAPATITLSGQVSAKTLTGPVPLAGVLVVVDTRWSTSTDAQGRYSIPGIPLAAANIEVSVSKIGYVSARRPAVTSGDVQIDIELDPRPVYTLSGVISEVTSSAGIEGVVVEFYSHVGVGNNAYDYTTTDAQGRYSLPGVWSGPDASTDIWLTKEGFRIEQLNNCDGCFRTLTITGDTELNVRLDRLPALAGVAASRTRHPR